MEIQDIDTFKNKIENVNKLTDDELITALVKFGAHQMTCVKFLVYFRQYSLPKSNEVVSNSKEWQSFTEGNDDIRNKFFENDKTDQRHSSSPTEE